MTRREHPTRDVFAQAAEHLDRRYARVGVGNYLVCSRDEYRGTAGVLSYSLSAMLNPIDTSSDTYRYDTTVMMQAVYFGQAAATLLSFEAYGITKAASGSIYRSLGGLPVSIAIENELASKAEQQHAVSIGLIDMGLDGLSIAGERAELWLDRVASDIVVDREANRYFGIAAGIAIKIYHDGIERIWQQNDREQLSDLIQKVDAGEISWEQSLAELIEGTTPQ